MPGSRRVTCACGKGEGGGGGRRGAREGFIEPAERGGLGAAEQGREGVACLRVRWDPSSSPETPTPTGRLSPPG